MRARPPSPKTRTLIASLGAISLLVGTACGSTAPHGAVTAEPAAGGTTSQGGGIAIPSGASGGGTTAGGVSGGSVSGGSRSYSGGITSSGGSVSGAGVTGSSAANPTTGQGVPNTGGSHLAVAGSVPGVTDTTIYIGSYYNKNQGAGNAALGAGGLDQGDARKPQNVMIHWINTHGGVAGRKLVPIYYGFDASGTGPPSDQQDQAACAKWTQDNKVFAILLSSPIIDECAKKEGAVEFGLNGTPSIYRKYPHRIDPDSMNKVRAEKVTVDGLAMHGFFDKGAKLGVVTWDNPPYHEAVDDGLVPALKSHGLTLATPPYYIASPQTFQDLGSASAAVNNAVLKFSTLGIDHVFIIDGQSGLCGGACLTIEWLKRAESQQYYPRYGFNDYNSAIELHKLGLLSARQAQGSLYINWIDIGPDYEEGYHSNEVQAKCVKLMRKNGIDMSNANSKSAAIDACASMWFLQTAALKMDALGLPLNADNFVNAIEALGYGYHSPFSYANYFSPQQHDGVAGVRHARWNTGKSKYVWIGTVYKVG